MLDRNDWRQWWGKVKWQLISFKFLSFWTFILLSIGSCYWLWLVYFKTIYILEKLVQNNILPKEKLSEIIINIQNILFNTALSNILLFFGTSLASVIAIKGVSYYTNSKNTVEAIKKIDSNPSAKEDLKQFFVKK